MFNNSFSFHCKRSKTPKKTHYSLRWLIHAMFTTFANSNYAVAAENALNILPRRREG